MNISNKFGTILIFHFNSILFQYLYKLYSFRCIKNYTCIEEEEVGHPFVISVTIQIIFSYKNPHNNNTQNNSRKEFIICPYNMTQYNHDNAQSAKTRLFALCEYN